MATAPTPRPPPETGGGERQRGQAEPRAHAMRPYNDALTPGLTHSFGVGTRHRERGEQQLQHRRGRRLSYCSQLV